MPTEPQSPSAVIWDWRHEPDPRARAREAAAARRQGLLGGAIGLAAAAVVHHFRPLAGAVIGGVAILFLLIALAFPLTLHRRLNALLARFAHAVGWAVTWLLMTVLYFVVFLPVGALLRATGRLRITTHPDAKLATYWTPHAGAGSAPTPESTGRYSQQF